MRQQTRVLPVLVSSIRSLPNSSIFPLLTCLLCLFSVFPFSLTGRGGSDRHTFFCRCSILFIFYIPLFPIPSHLHGPLVYLSNWPNCRVLATPSCSFFAAISILLPRQCRVVSLLSRLPSLLAPKNPSRPRAAYDQPWYKFSAPHCSANSKGRTPATFG